MQDFTKLRVWQEAHRLALSLYRTLRLPPDENFGLRSQIRRAAVSVPANIAEGCARPSSRESCRFLGYAQGSANELQYFLLLLRDLGYLDLCHAEPLMRTATKVSRMLRALTKKVEGSE